MYRYLASEEKKDVDFIFLWERHGSIIVCALCTLIASLQEEHFASFRLENHFFKRVKDCLAESGSGLDAGDVLDVVDVEHFDPDVLGLCWSLSVLDLKFQFNVFVKLVSIVCVESVSWKAELSPGMGTFQQILHVSQVNWCGHLVWGRNFTWKKVRAQER